MPLVGCVALSACVNSSDAYISIEDFETPIEIDEATSQYKDPTQQHYENFTKLAADSHASSTMIFSPMPCPGSTGYRVETRHTYKRGQTVFQDGIRFNSSVKDGNREEGWIVSGMRVESEPESYDAMCVNIHDKNGLMTFIITDALVISEYTLINCLEDEQHEDQQLLNSAVQNTC